MGQMPINLQTLRIKRLHALCRAGTWWMIALGLLSLATGDRYSLWLGPHTHKVAAPLMRSLGFSTLLLGIVIKRSLKDPQQQAMGVDLLALYFLFQVLIVTTAPLSEQPWIAGEWLVTAVNLAFGIALIILRSKSRNLAGYTLEAEDARLAAKETILRLKKLLEEKKR